MYQKKVPIKWTFSCSRFSKKQEKTVPLSLFRHDQVLPELTHTKTNCGRTLILMSKKCKMSPFL